MELLDRLGDMDILPAGFKMEQAAAPVEPEIPVETPAAPVEEPAEAPAQGEAAAPAAEEPDSEAAALVESMRSVIDAFAAGDAALSAKEDSGSPFEIGFDDADKLFDENGEKTVADPFAQSEEDDDYDNFDDEEQDSTRVLNLNDLQFGRNYNKD